MQVQDQQGKSSQRQCSKRFDLGKARCNPLQNIFKKRPFSADKAAAFAENEALCKIRGDIGGSLFPKPTDARARMKRWPFCGR